MPLEKVKVNPRKGDDGKPMKAFDSVGRIIPFKEKGTEVERTTIISRQIKSGDLIIVSESTPKKKDSVEKKSTKKKKVEVK